MTFEGMAGIAVGLIAIVAPEWLPKMRKITRDAITLVGFILLAYSGILLLEDLSGMKVQTGPLFAIIFGFLAVAGGVVWHIHMANSESKEAGKSKTEATPVPSRGPTLEVTNNSKLNAAGATFSGEMKNQFVRVDNHSELQMPNAIVTTKDGVTNVQPGAAVFPAPTGEYKWLSSAELRKKIEEISTGLHQLQLGFDADYAKLSAEGLSEEKIVILYDKYSEPYKQRFAKNALELAAEMFSRNPTPFSTPSNLLPGHSAVLYGRFSGLNHDVNVTKFLETLAAHMDAKG